MKDEIKEILQDLEKVAKCEYYPEDLLYYENCQKLLDYITTLQEENEKLKQSLESRLKYSDELYERIEVIDKAVEYGKNCLENIKDQHQYMCESIDIVVLLQMIHLNYLDILQGDDK